jgi:hypothetical protein
LLSDNRERVGIGSGRSGWVNAYCGRASEALEEFQIARSLAPADPLNFLWSVGIASAKFQNGCYDESIHWYRRAQAKIRRARGPTVSSLRLMCWLGASATAAAPLPRSRELIPA